MSKEEILNYIKDRIAKAKIRKSEVSSHNSKSRWNCVIEELRWVSEVVENESK